MASSTLSFSLSLSHSFAFVFILSHVHVLSPSVTLIGCDVPSYGCWCALVFTNRRGGQWDSVRQLIAVCSAREESFSPYTTAAFGGYAWPFRFAPLSLMWKFRVSEWGKCESYVRFIKKSIFDLHSLCMPLTTSYSSHSSSESLRFLND